MSVCQHFPEAVTKLQKNFKKLAIVCCHKRCLCKICFKIQLPVVGTPVVQVYSVLVLFQNHFLEIEEGYPKTQINHALRTVLSETMRRVLFAFQFFQHFNFSPRFSVFGPHLLKCMLTQRPAKKSYLNILLRTDMKTESYKACLCDP